MSVNIGDFIKIVVGDYEPPLMRGSVHRVIGTTGGNPSRPVVNGGGDETLDNWTIAEGDYHVIPYEFVVSALRKAMNSPQVDQTIPTSIADGGPAFPPVHDPKSHESGMTLRDWFAGMALANPRTHPGNDSTTEDIAIWAYGLADAMLAERKVK